LDSITITPLERFGGVTALDSITITPLRRFGGVAALGYLSTYSAGAAACLVAALLAALKKSQALG